MIQNTHTQTTSLCGVVAARRFESRFLDCRNCRAASTCISNLQLGNTRSRCFHFSRPWWLIFDQCVDVLLCASLLERFDCICPRCSPSSELYTKRWSWSFGWMVQVLLPLSHIGFCKCCVAVVVSLHQFLLFFELLVDTNIGQYRSFYPHCSAGQLIVWCSRLQQEIARKKSLVLPSLCIRAHILP